MEKADFSAWVRNVWQVVQGIPRGCVLTYGDVARLAGGAGSARRVSQAMRRAPRGMKLPWHRVINARGEISIRSRAGAARQQQALLESEGIVFTAEGRVDLARFRWRP